MDSFNAFLTTLQQYSYYLFYSGLVILALSLSHSRSRHYPLPPGPAGIPLIGNIFDLSKKAQFLQFSEWSKVYGPIFSLNLLGQQVIVLNSHRVAGDLLDRRSNIYSDRPRFIVVYEYLSDKLLFSGAPYGDYWRRSRKAAHESLNTRVAPYVQPIQEKEAANLVLSLIDDSESWDGHMKRSSASSILSLVYGMPPVTSIDDPLIVRIMQHMHRNVEGGQPGQHLVEAFPILKWVPSFMAKWKRDSIYWCQEDTRFFEELLSYTQKAIDHGESTTCFSATWIQNAERYGLNFREIAWLAGTMFGAGVETTSAALSAFIMAMTLYPDVLRKAQEEIDSVVGRERVPAFNDREHLPYVRAIVKETLRWWPVGPIGVPHRVREDDIYDGYLIPKGSTIIYNVWAMNRWECRYLEEYSDLLSALRDPELYPDFDVFRPERFLDVSGEVDVTPADTHKQGHVTFGFGRRTCVGLNVANQSLFIGIAYMLWALNIQAITDDANKLILPSRDDMIDEGLIVRPKPFKCCITPRLANVRTLVETAAH